MAKLKIVLITLIVATLLSSCLSISNNAKFISDLTAEDRIQNKEIALARGERDFNVSPLTLIKAYIITFSQFNMAVVNLDKDIGYILAEGEPPVSPEKLQELGIRNVDRLNERYGSKVFVYMGSNSKHRVTVNITQKNESVTTAKMSFSSEVISNQPIKGHELPPFFTDAMYTSIWNELDKQLFILQSTTSN